MSDTTDGGWTRHSESESTVHEDVKQESDGNSSFTFELSKPTGGDASGSVAFTFGGGSGDEWHVLDESDSEWEDHYDSGYGSTEIHQGTSKSKYKMDDVYSSSYGGDPSATLATDGSTTASGSSHAEEDYTFDQVSESENKWGEETSNTYVTYSPDGSPMPTITSWDKWEEEHKFKTTDHYEAELSVDTGSESESDTTSETLAGSDIGFTDIEWFNKTCHAWNYNGTPGGPDCNESTGTDYEDWPSLVDAYLAMMEMEAEMEAPAEESSSLVFVTFPSNFESYPRPRVEIIYPALVLPGDPSGLPGEWVVDPTHQYPHGTRYRHPGGDYLDWHPGRPGLPGWRGRDHWHWNDGEEHLAPGDVITVPTPIVVPIPVPMWQQIWEQIWQGGFIIPIL